MTLIFSPKEEKYDIGGKQDSEIFNSQRRRGLVYHIINLYESKLMIIIFCISKLKTDEIDMI